MTRIRWAQLEPDAAMLSALEEADVGGARASLVTGATQNDKKKWSNRFADACARMVADALRRQSGFGRGFTIRPSSTGPAEPMTFAVGRSKRGKRLDVSVSSDISGLQLGISLKGLNFRDSSGNQFDKNLTGRTYELRDEMRFIHGHQPRAFMAAIYFMPLASTVDKPKRSSFAHTVQHLRSCTGRLDPMLPSQLDRADFTAVGLYVPGDGETDPIPGDRPEPRRGVVRYFDVMDDPPQYGRPVVATTMSVGELMARLVESYDSMDGAAVINWAEPE